LEKKMNPARELKKIAAELEQNLKKADVDFIQKPGYRAGGWSIVIRNAPEDLVKASKEWIETERIGDDSEFERISEAFYDAYERWAISEYSNIKKDLPDWLKDADDLVELTPELRPTQLNGHTLVLESSINY